MDFFYKYPLVRKFLIYLIYTIAIFLITTIGILYINTSELILSKDVLFSFRTYIFIFHEYKDFIYITIIVAQFLFIGMLLLKNYQLKISLDSSTKDIHMEDIAHIWLKNKESRREDSK